MSTPRTPPAVTRGDKLTERLNRALEAKGARYRPRTHHRADDGSPTYNNRLLFEKSPYLLQHAHNPVDWHPWSKAAFDYAKRESRPVFLSVGYSTCHWCHVMERESFEDEEIAAFINAHFVAVKVDREERPDVDGIYMTAVQAITGHGGWPMSVFLTPEKQPFFAGTYFPARDGDRGPHRGFLSLLRALHDAWSTQREQIRQDAAAITQAVQQELSSKPVPSSTVPSADILDEVVRACDSRFDNIDGGLQSQTKFPSQLPVRLLLRRHAHTGDERALHMARYTLEKMQAGGMYDHLAGGFHRYSTDPKWLAPHFEKMLYDNALLTVAYLEGHQVTGDPRFERVARETLDYVAREMTAPGGGFYSATDADSLAPNGESVEGWSFTWSTAEIAAELGREGLELISRVYGVTPAGNFEGRNILHLTRPVPDEVRDELDDLRAQLLAARNERPQPLRDDKVLCAWNGLMVSAFAKAALQLNEARYLDAARAAANFALEHLREDGELRRVYLAGEAGHTGLLDDHAFLCQGLLDLFEADSDPRWLREAKWLDDELEDRFEDDAGGWFLTPHEHEVLLVREKPRHDGAEPSGTSIHTQNLLRLHALTDDASYRERAEAALRTVTDRLGAPLAVTDMLIALDMYHSPGPQIVIAGPGARQSALMDVARRSFVPGAVIIARDDLSVLEGATPLVEDREADEPTAWLCRGFVCDAPTTAAKALEEQLASAI